MDPTITDRVSQFLARSRRGVPNVEDCGAFGFLFKVEYDHSDNVMN